MTDMHAYRTHDCAALRADNAGDVIRLSGWVHRKRDHGGVLFIDLRDHFGITQILADSDSKAFAPMDALRSESVICITGRVMARADEAVNKKLPTGDIEVYVDEMEILSAAEELPMPIFGDAEYPEETRLRYRFLDLRREEVHNNMILRSNVISSLRGRMVDQGFMEIQTPILTASSPDKPCASRQILCLATSTAAIQTVTDGQRF